MTNLVRKPAYASFNSASAGKARLQILHASGRVINQQTVEAVAAINGYSLAVGNLKPGMYCLRMLVGTRSESKFFTVQ